MTADETSWQAWLHCITGVSIRLIASLCSDNHATWQVKEPSAIWSQRVVSSFPAGLDQHVWQLRVQCRGLLMVRSVHPWGEMKLKTKKIKKGAWSWQVVFFLAWHRSTISEARFSQHKGSYLFTRSAWKLFFLNMLAMWSRVQSVIKMPSDAFYCCRGAQSTRQLPQWH